MIAALYVQTGGAYFGVDGVEPWDEARDARTYAGPYPVVAHPPCARWGRYAAGRPGFPEFSRGDDGGCFSAAIAAVRRWGGVLEHPADSSAWLDHHLPSPEPAGWAGTICSGWTCRVDQGHYGHAAPKPTWLYVFGTVPANLVWGPSDATGRVENQSRRQRAATPPLFRDLLLSIARITNV